MYDIGRMESFLNVKKWFERARLLGGEFIEAVLVGNKSDTSSSARQVSTEKGRTLASELGIPFVETSAKDGNGVDQAFVSMAANIKKSVDKRGLAGVSKNSLESAGSVVLSDGDKKMSMSQKCC